MTFSASDQRILDCHAAFVHGFLSLEELYQEAWANSPVEDLDPVWQLRHPVILLGEAARTLIEKRAAKAFGC